MRPARAACCLSLVFLAACASMTNSAPSEVLVPLDHLGIADARFLNPKAPFALLYTAGLGGDVPPPIVFENRTGDRELLVQIAFDVPIELSAELMTMGALRGNVGPRLEAIRERLAALVKERETEMQRDLNDVDKLTCDAASARSAVIETDLVIVPCSVRFKVGRGRPVPVPYSFVGNLPEVFSFDVGFFEETEKPANARGYIAKVTTPAAVAKQLKRDTKFDLAPVGIIAVAHDPEIKNVAADGKTAIITADLPYRGDHRTHASAEGRVDVTGNYVNDVDAEVSFRFKKSDLGFDDGKTVTEASQYKLRVYAQNGLRAEFGKFRFSNPSDGIAVNEFGEGLRFDLGSIRLPRAIGSPSISHVVKRESASPVLPADKGDRYTTIFEWKNFPLTRSGEVHTAPFRTLNLLALWGRDESFEDDHSYQTYGGEMFFTHRHGVENVAPALAAPAENRGYLSGSLAAYYNRRNGLAPSLDGSGSVMLAKANYSPNLVVKDGKTSSPLTYGIVFGYGSADDPDSTTEDEGFLGETQSFAPDVLFLSTLAKPIIEGDKTLEVGSRTGLRSGLSGKYYNALRITTDKSPLRWIAHEMGNDADVQSSTTIISLHNYWLHVDDFQHAASELDVDFQIVAPARVRVSVGFAVLLPGGAMSKQLDLPPWAITASMTIDPKL